MVNPGGASREEHSPLHQVGWFAWTSPVGAGIGLMSAGTFFVLITLGIRILAEIPY